MTLFINCCPRRESRTMWLAGRLLDKLGEYEEVDLEKDRPSPLDRERLERRTALIAGNDFSDDMFSYAKQFAAADTIVIAAPYWDLSFPARLKTYIENIYVTGIVSRYGEDGRPVGLCRTERLYYITTAGGPYEPQYSFGYIKDLAENYFGIGRAELIYAEMLDIIGNDPEKILLQCAQKYGI